MVELKRELGLKEVVATIVTGVIGGGLFISAIQIQSDVSIGSGIIIAFILAAIPSIIIALCYAVLAPIFPESGGEYVFVSRMFRPVYRIHRYVGTMVRYDCYHCSDGSWGCHSHSKFFQYGRIARCRFIYYC